MSWYSKDREASSQKEQEILSKLSGNKVFRFRIKPGETCNITFLDTPMFYFAEHTVKQGTGFTTITCIGEEEHCPLCAQGEIPSFSLAATVINHGEYKTKKGNVIKNRKQLIVLKGKAKRAIEKQIDKHKGNIQYFVYEADRDISPTSCSTGELFDLKGKLTKDKLAKFVPEGVDADEYLAPFDYEELLAPQDASNIKTEPKPTPTGVGSGAEESPFTDLEPADVEDADNPEDFI